MITYEKSGKIKSQSAPAQGVVETEAKDERVKINGFQQVLEMLQVADPQFRNSLLSRLEKKDPSLVAQLRRTLKLRG